MEHILILNACCIICQKLKVVEVEDVQEDSDAECESDTDPYGSLDGGSPRNFSGDEVDRKGKEGNKNGEDEDDDPEDDDPEPRSPNIDIKSTKRVRIYRIVIYQIRVTYGVEHTKILEAIVTPNLQPAGYVVACVLFSKMQDARWRIIQSHQNGDGGYVHIKMRNRDLVRFHGKMYEWDGARVTFCMVQTILPIIPTDPMDQHHVIKI
jgi:hypothetical protein